MIGACGLTDVKISHISKKIATKIGNSVKNDEF